MKNITVSPTTSMTKIQEYLKGGYTVEFSEGIYHITKTLFVYSNTNIILDKGAVLNRMAQCYVFMTYADANTTKYLGQKNISISGGTIKGDGCKKSSNIISLVHAQNVTIKDLTIRNNVGSHAIEINSSKDITISNCTFDKNIISKDGEFREAIQIDMASYLALTYARNKSAKCYDLTHCSNINLIGNHFNGFNVCIGTHTQSKNSDKHKGIKILNNDFKGIGVVKGYGSCIKILNFEDVTIDNNIISGFARGIEIATANKFYSANGSTTTVKPNGVTGSKDIVIRNNLIKSPSNDFKSSGVFISSNFDDIVHDNILIENNTFKLNNGVSKYDVYYENATNVVDKNNKSDL